MLYTLAEVSGHVWSGIVRLILKVLLAILEEPP